MSVACASHGFRVCVGAMLFLAAGGPPFASSKKLAGSTSLGPGQAKVVAKFCFDYNPACKDGNECLLPPGKANFEIFGAQDIGAGASASGASIVNGKKVEMPQVSIALLDDEYFSYPEVSQVWGEANCSDVIKSAKKSYPLSWRDISSSKGQVFETHVVEKIRPRWWFIAVVSCSDHSLQMDYRMYLENLLQGSNSQLSMDEIGAVFISFLVFVIFGGLAAVHIYSYQRWSEFRSGPPAGHRLLAVSVLFAVLGSLCWLSFFRQYKATGETPDSLAVLARLCVCIAKTLLQILLMLLAQGECICTPGITWARQHEMMAGMAAFGCFGFLLEVWGDREASGSSIEYIYDTRPGIALVAMEMMWLYAYTTRCWQTFTSETRQRPRRFFKRYASMLSLWFLSLPAVALLASVLAPWVRFRIAFLVSGMSHALAVGVLVYLFHPYVAPDLFSFDAKDQEGKKDELSSLLGSPGEDDDLW